MRPDRDYIPMEDRWRLGFPAWDRYQFTPEYPYTNDYPYQLGHWWDPFNQNVLKGDYPIIGQHTFLNITGTVRLIGQGVHAVGKKVVEEAAESWMAAEHEGPERAAEEISQLLYHAQALMIAAGVSLSDLYERL